VFRPIVSASGGGLIMDDANFWAKLDSLVENASVVVDRPKGSVHPRLPTLTYPLDYGFLSGTTSGDGHGVDVWIGSLKRRRVTGVVCTVDLSKRDAEVKILLGCSLAEQRRILALHNFKSGRQGGVLISRPRRKVSSRLDLEGEKRSQARRVTSS
jgi:inorganic pyrophosphatase